MRCLTRKPAFMVSYLVELQLYCSAIAVSISDIDTIDPANSKGLLISQFFCTFLAHAKCRFSCRQLLSELSHRYISACICSKLHKVFIESFKRVWVDVVNCLIHVRCQETFNKTHYLFEKISSFSLFPRESNRFLHKKIVRWRLYILY